MWQKIAMFPLPSLPPTIFFGCEPKQLSLCRWKEKGGKKNDLSIPHTIFNENKHGGNMVFEIITYVALSIDYIFHHCSFKFFAI